MDLSVRVVAETSTRERTFVRFTLRSLHVSHKTISNWLTGLGGWVAQTSGLVLSILVIAFLGFVLWTAFQLVYVAAGGLRVSETSLFTMSKKLGPSGGATASGTSDATDPPPSGE